MIVEGEAAYREAKDFMKMLMPSHAKNVKLYKDSRPLFSRHQVESQLDGLYSPTVTLPSGGYMVINQTEALVSVDINSGKATREHNIEDTAYKTNLEASDEIARQLRLRDLAGLVVIDFIDMEEKRNNRNVERRLKEALKNDRARIQVGRISHFGLLEMSRQRLRPGLLEGSSRTCPHCEGRGIVRSISSCGLSVLRTIEEHLIARKPENLTVKCAPRRCLLHPEREARQPAVDRDNLWNLDLHHPQRMTSAARRPSSSAPSTATSRRAACRRPLSAWTRPSRRTRRKRKRSPKRSKLPTRQQTRTSSPAVPKGAARMDRPVRPIARAAAAGVGGADAVAVAATAPASVTNTAATGWKAAKLRDLASSPCSPMAMAMRFRRTQPSPAVTIRRMQTRARPRPKVAKCAIVHRGAIAGAGTAVDGGATMIAVLRARDIGRGLSVRRRITPPRTCRSSHP